MRAIRAGIMQRVISQHTSDLDLQDAVRAEAGGDPSV